MAKVKRKRRPGQPPRPSQSPRHGARARSWLRLPPLDRSYVLLLVLAAALRLWGIGDRLPDHTLGINIMDDTAIEETDRTTITRSWGMWRGGAKPLDLNPHTSGWPSFSFYLTLAVQVAYKGWYLVVHPGVGPAEFAEAVERDVTPLFLLARLVGATIGVLSVALTWRLALFVGGRRVALLAALLVATSPLHVLTSQHVSDPNLLAFVFVALAAASMVKVAEGGGVRASVWAGLWIGLAGACKYVPIVLLLPLFLAHPRGTRWRGTAMAAGAALIAMFAASPFTFLDWNMTADAFTVQRRSLLSPWVGQSEFPIALPTYLIESLPRALGWPVYALSLLGFVLLWRGGRAGRVLAGSALAIVLANGMLRAAQERYMLVAFPLFFTAAATGVVWIVERVAARAPGRATNAAFAGIALVALAWPLPELWRVRSALRLPDSRHESRRWINANIDRETRVAVELYGPVVDQRERNVVIWPFFATQAPLVRAAYHVAFLDGVRYIVTSGEISRRFLGDSLNYPVEAAYYRRLRDTGQIVWRSDPERFAGPLIEVRALPESLGTRAERDSIFDHYVPDSIGTYRLALWCMDFSTLFGRTGEFARAEEWSRRGLHVDSKRMNPRLYGSLAFSQYQEGDFEGAAETAARGLAETPGAYALHFYRGMALQSLGRLEEALAEIRQALDASGDPRMRLNMGQLLAQLGRDDEAVAQLEQVPPGHPERAAARRDMAVILLNRLGRREEGIAALREAAALTPDPGEARLLRDEAARLERGGRTQP